MNLEQVGEKFSEHEMDHCQEKSWQLLHALAEKIKPGMSEEEAHVISNELFASFQSEKKWHPSKIRFGKNTVKTFREVSDPTIRLQENDIFFLDLGPIFNGHEGDVGKTFVLGKLPAAEKLIAVGEEIFGKVRNRWKETGESGAQLYAYASGLAKEYGYELSLTSGSGHRISDFPHAIYHKGALREFEHTPQAYRWILEIQLRDHANQIGTFFEDILK